MEKVKKEEPKEENKSDIGRDIIYLGSIASAILIFSLIFLGALDTRYNLPSSKPDIIGNMTTASTIVVNQFYDIGATRPDFWYYFFFGLLAFFAYLIIELFYNAIKNIYSEYQRRKNAHLEGQRRQESYY